MERLNKIYDKYVNSKDFHENEGFNAYSYKESEIDRKRPFPYSSHKTNYGGSSCHYEIVLKVSSLNNATIEKQFNELALKWRKETIGISTMIHIAGNNNYLDIIGMGMDVVPFILKDLQKEPDFWFVALKHITKANPVPKEHLGKIEKMTLDWLDWGRKNNLI